MKLSDNIQRILNALAHANAGENLTRRQKHSALAGTPAVTRADDFVAPVASVEHAQLALYLGSELSDEVMQYVVRTCSRMQYGLTVLTMQSQKDAEALLAAHDNALSEAGIHPRVVPLSGDPARALAQTLRRRPEVAFLVCNESGYLGRSLLNGTQNGLPVPVVLVSPGGAVANAATPARIASARSA